MDQRNMQIKVCRCKYPRKTCHCKERAFKWVTCNLFIQAVSIAHWIRDSSVGIALGYGLDDRGSRVRFSAEAGDFSLHHSVQIGSGAHPASYPMGTRGSFPGGKAAGVWSWPLTSI
jgi:hypothetical protein